MASRVAPRYCLPHFRKKRLQVKWNERLLDLKDENLMHLEVGELAGVLSISLFYPSWSSNPRLPIDSGTLSLEKDKHSANDSGDCDQPYSIEENSFKVYNFPKRALGELKELIEIIIRPAVCEERNRSVAKYTGICRKPLRRSQHPFTIVVQKANL